MAHRRALCFLTQSVLSRVDARLESSPSLRISFRDLRRTLASRGFERLGAVYSNSSVPVAIQMEETIKRLLRVIHFGESGLCGGASRGAGLARSRINIDHFLDAVERFHQGLHTQGDSVLRRLALQKAGER